ncbi:TetR/AcrR family transcriptional regulator [Gordonia malaquae]|uniref:TetR/AcrR family transcriptional regulator n=1 Tax=Gordonia malaquae TaxID=410332 RepID=UPI0030FEF1BF
MNDTRRKRYTRASKEALLDAARESFSTIGYDATAVADITGKADLSKGAFYRHFSDKRAAFIELFIERLEVAGDLIQDGERDLDGKPRGKGILVAARVAAEFASMSISDPVHRELLRQAPEVLGADVYEEIDNEHILTHLVSLLEALDARDELAEGLPLHTIGNLLLRVVCAGNTLVSVADNQQLALSEVLTSLSAFFVGVTAPDLRH